MVALQTMKLESHTPPQIDPPVEMVAMLGLLLLKVISAAMAPPAEFSAIAEIVVTSPSFNETVVGERTMVAGIGLVAALPPPQPARRERQMAVTSAARTRTKENCRMYPPRRTKSWRTHEREIISCVKLPV
jgi:hypothetical protein